MVIVQSLCQLGPCRKKQELRQELRPGALHGYRQGPDIAPLCSPGYLPWPSARLGPMGLLIQHMARHLGTSRVNGATRILCRTDLGLAPGSPIFPTILVTPLFPISRQNGIHKTDSIKHTVQASSHCKQSHGGSPNGRDRMTRCLGRHYPSVSGRKTGGCSNVAWGSALCHSGKSRAIQAWAPNAQ